LGKGVGQGDAGASQHQSQACEIGESSQGRAFVCGQGHDGERQSDSGRYDKPAVAMERTHPSQFYES
jgi:hypothetical protein